MEDYGSRRGNGSPQGSARPAEAKIEGAAQWTQTIQTGALGRLARRGVTLIEAVLFIAVALGLIVGGLVFYQQASLAARVNEQTRLFSSMYAEVNALFVESRWRPVDLEEQFLINDVLLSSGAVGPEFFLGNLGDVASAEFKMSSGMYSDDISNVKTIKSAWNTPSFWAIGDAFALGSTTIPGRYIVSFILSDLSPAECSRFLNSVVFGTTQSSPPDYVVVDQQILLRSQFSVSALADLCSRAGADGDAGRVTALGVEWVELSF
jgi:hypothetical protein